MKDASLDRLVCLQRHWMWADEAMASVHQAFGEALRKEHLSREIDALDP